MRSFLIQSQASSSNPVGAGFFAFEPIVWRRSRRDNVRREQGHSESVKGCPAGSFRRWVDIRLQIGCANVQVSPPMKDDSVLHANLAVFYFLLFSVLFLGGEVPLIAAEESSHAKLNTSLLLSNLELAPARITWNERGASPRILAVTSRMRTHPVSHIVVDSPLNSGSRFRAEAPQQSRFPGGRGSVRLSALEWRAPSGNLELTTMSVRSWLLAPRCLA